MGEDQPLLQRFADLLESEGLSFDRHEEAHALRVDYEGQDAEWGCIVQAWEDDRVIVCYSVSPLRPIAQTMAETADFLHRVNVGLLIGNFEIDFADGETRFKTSLGLGPYDPWSDDLARVILYTNLAVMDRYARALLLVVTGGATAEQAIEMIHADDEAT
jgi:hypothetical protein